MLSNIIVVAGGAGAAAAAAVPNHNIAQTIDELS